MNERDALGDNLVPDYITHVQDGGFYGWPWWYMGGNPDPRLKGKHPELKDKVITPDVLLQPHNASLQFAFYTGKQFPAEARKIFYDQAPARPIRGQATNEEHDELVDEGIPVARLPLPPTGKLN